jgi:hypothetical protein
LAKLVNRIFVRKFIYIFLYTTIPANDWDCILIQWVVPEKIHTPPTEEISAVRRGRGEKIVSDNSKCIRTSKGVGGLTSYFLRGGGMDVFWNDPLLTSVNNVGSKTLFNPVKQQARRFLPCRGQMHGITNYPIAFPYLYRSRTCDICKISTFKFSNVWVDKK